MRHIQYISIEHENHVFHDISSRLCEVQAQIRCGEEVFMRVTTHGCIAGSCQVMLHHAQILAMHKPADTGCQETHKLHVREFFYTLDTAKSA